MLLERGRKTIGPVARLGTAGVLFLSSVSCSENKSPSGPDSLDNSQRTERQATDLEFPFTSGKWYFTNGPHPDVEPLTDAPKILSSLDFAPEEIIPCKNNEQDQVKWDKDWVTSPINGEVILVGDENNLQDKNHGLVEIKMDKDPSAEILMAHLTDLQIEEGEHVNVGDPLGHASCAHSPLATNTGVHIHEEFRINNIPIDISNARIVIAGEFEIKGDGEQNSQGFYDGALDGHGKVVVQNGGRSSTNLIPSYALLGSIDEDESTETPTQENSDRNFVSQNLGFSVNIPEGWKSSEAILSKNIASFTPPEEGYPKSVIVVQVKDPNNGEYFAEPLEANNEYINKLLTDNNTIVNMGSPRNIMVNGVDAEEWIGQISPTGDSFDHLDYIIFIKNGKLWTLSYTAVEGFNNYEDEFKNFVDSFSAN